MILPIGFLIRFIHVLIISHRCIDVDRSGDGRLLVVIPGAGGVSSHAAGHASLRRLAAAAPAAPAVAAVAVRVVTVLSAGRRGVSCRQSYHERRGNSKAFLHSDFSQARASRTPHPSTARFRELFKSAPRFNMKKDRLTFYRYDRNLLEYPGGTLAAIE